MVNNKIYIAIDLQNDFIDGVLGSKEAEGIAEGVKTFISNLSEDDELIFTYDTHLENEKSLEIERLPKHCVKNTDGWMVRNEIYDATKAKVTNLIKYSFGSRHIAEVVEQIAAKNNTKIEDVEIVMFGLCTDICVISNALLLRSVFTNTKITVIESLCAGSSLKNHIAAIDIMRMNLIDIK